jgi:glucose/arabinose dehydrogenase
VRIATGIRNAVALTIDRRGQLWAVQHGRDNLYSSFPTLFSAVEGAENPAEELFLVRTGSDFGWPNCYHDFGAGRRVLAPEYGGDRTLVGRCAATTPATAVFPGHWAPNGMVFYPGTAFPPRYRHGAFIAFHGSHNRTPLPQAGFQVVFVPASGDGLATTYEVFADGFAGGTVQLPSQARYRPTGLAVDSVGALYITDDRRGRIWRVVSR